MRVFHTLISFLKANNPFKGLMRIIPGCFALVRYSFVSDNTSVCLSMLSTSFFTVTPGQGTHYEISIFNCTDHSLTVRLAVHVSRKKILQWSRAHCASYEQEIHLSARGAKSVEFIYDWQGIPWFVIDNVRYEPASRWRDKDYEPGLYWLDAVLSGSEGRICDKLTLVQELIG